MSDLPNLQDVFTGRIFRIPEYQRGYSWERPQWQDLLDDLDEMQGTREHYTGTLILQPSDGKAIVDARGEQHFVFDVVDGQQRLATLLILLDAIRRMARAEQDGTLQSLAEGIEWRFLRVAAKGQSFSKLEFSDGSQDYFERHVLAEKPSPMQPSTPAQRRLADAAGFFRDNLRARQAELGGGYADWLLEIHGKVSHRLKLNLYKVDSEDEVGVIFEVMNNRGKDLSELDLVKNYVLYVNTRLDLEDQVRNTLRAAVAEDWTRIFTNLMTARLDDVEHENRLLRAHWLACYDYDRARSWDGSRGVKRRLSLRGYHDDHAGLLKALRHFVDSLADASIAYCDAQDPTRPSAFGVFREDAKRRHDIIRMSDCLVRTRDIAPFLPLLISTRLTLPTDADRYLQIVELCELYAFRVYKLRERRSHTGESALFRLAYHLYHGNLTFEDMARQFAGLIRGYCPDQFFHDAFELGDEAEDNDWYGWDGLTYFLFEYERARSGNEDLGISWSEVQRAGKRRTIEHILPQNPNDEYWLTRFDDETRALLLHDFGNLCLTQNNSNYGRKSFPAKRGTPGNPKAYAGAPLQQERDLADVTDYPEWGPQQIRDRHARLAAWARERWAIPKLWEDVTAADVEPDDDPASDEDGVS